MAGTAIAHLFSADPQRFENYSLEFEGLMLDYSKNLVNAETMQLLITLAQERDVTSQAERMFRGDKINTGEKRAALHTALRGNTPVTVDGNDVLPAIRASREQMRIFSTEVRLGEIAGHGKQKITDVVNLGIGGSHLGPALDHGARAVRRRPAHTFRLEHRSGGASARAHFPESNDDFVHRRIEDFHYA